MATGYIVLHVTPSYQIAWQTILTLNGGNPYLMKL